MKEDDPSIRATLAAFPEDDPKNPQRHDLLVETSLAAPPLHPDQPSAPAAPPHYLARAKNSLRSLTPCLAAFPLIFTLIAAENHRREIDHVSRNTFERISPESALGINRIERENNEALRSTILRILETATSP